MTIELTEVQTLADLLQTFNELRRKAHNGAFLFLHIEAHGDNTGLQLSSGVIVAWSDINRELRRLNIILRNSLMVFLSMCEGESIVSAIDTLDRAPFRAVIGNPGVVGERSLLNAFSAFYDRFFFSFDVNMAVELMNQSLSAHEKKFHYLKSDKLFDAILDPDRDVGHFEQQTELHAQSMFESKRKPSESFEMFLQRYRDFLRSELSALRRNRDYFMMKDLGTAERLDEAPARPGLTVA